MTFPLNFNNNIGMFSGLMPTSFGSTSQPDTLSIFPAQIANQYSPIDTFCTNMWMNQAQLEKQYFALMKYAEKMYNKLRDERLNSKSK